MKINSIIIPVHSLADLISNSSSETYVFAGQKTIDFVKELVGLNLKTSGSPHKPEDLFDFSLVVLENEEYQDAEGEWCEREVYVVYDKNKENYNPPVIKVAVKEQFVDDPSIKELAAILNKMQNAFWAEEVYR